MSYFFTALSLIAFICLIAGLIEPSLVIRWGDPAKRNRKKVWVIYFGLYFVFGLAGGATAPEPDVAIRQTKQSQAEPIKKPEPTPQAQSQPAQKPEPTPQPKAQPVKKSEPTPEEIKKIQQDAFLSWYAGLEIQLKKYDSDSVVWKNTFTALSNSSISRYQAYAQLKPLVNTTKKLMKVFGKMEPPMALSKEHQKMLRDGTQDLGLMAYSRKKSVEKALLCFEDLEDSTLQEAIKYANQADTHMIRGIFAITTVRAQLGLEN